MKQTRAVIGESPGNVGVNMHLLHVLLLTMRSVSIVASPYLCPLLPHKGLQVQCSRNV